MKKSGVILAAAALLMVSTQIHAQTPTQLTGTSNPDALNDNLSNTAPVKHSEIGVFAPVVRPPLPGATVATTQPAPQPTAAAAPSAKPAAAPTVAPVAAPHEAVAAVPAATPKPAPAPVAVAEAPVTAVPATPAVAPHETATILPAAAPQPAPAPVAVSETPAVAVRDTPVAVVQVKPLASRDVSEVLPRDKPMVVTDDVNSGIVTEVASAPNELPEGTLLRVRLGHEISTSVNEKGDRFQALLTAPIERHGKVVLPAGAVLNGRVTGLYSGHHIGKHAAIHLQPDSITLPDGSSYKLDAQVIDLFMVDHSTHVSSEGTITGNDRTPGTVAALGITTGTATVTGAALGGAVGAFVGAAIGAGASTVIWFRQDSSQTLPQGTEIVFSLNRPMLLENVTH